MVSTYSKSVCMIKGMTEPTIRDLSLGTTQLLRWFLFFVFRWPDTVLTLCSVFERTASKCWLSSAWRDLCKLLLLTSQMPIHRKVDPGICKGWRGTAGWWLNGQAFMSRRWVSHTGCFVLWTCISFRPAVLFYTKLGRGAWKPEVKIPRLITDRLIGMIHFY